MKTRTLKIYIAAFTVLLIAAVVLSLNLHSLNSFLNDGSGYKPY